jgi:hypothetical protein
LHENLHKFASRELVIEDCCSNQTNYKELVCHLDDNPKCLDVMRLAKQQAIKKPPGAWPGGFFFDAAPA